MGLDLEDFIRVQYDIFRNDPAYIPPLERYGLKVMSIGLLVGERDAVLEFECEIDGVLVNGVDIVRWNDAGRIVDFKVMLRPLKAIQLVQERLAARFFASPVGAPFEVGLYQRFMDEYARTRGFCVAGVDYAAEFDTDDVCGLPTSGGV